MTIKHQKLTQIRNQTLKRIQDVKQHLLFCQKIKSFIIKE